MNGSTPMMNEFREIFDADMFDSEDSLHLPELSLEQTEGLEPDPELVALIEEAQKAVA